MKMIRFLYLGTLLLLLCGALALSAARPAMADTYRWTDREGNLHFTDTLESVPARYRDKVTTGDDITTADPEVRAEVEEGRRRAEVVAREESQRRETRKRQEEAQARQQRAAAPSRTTAPVRTDLVQTRRGVPPAAGRRVG